MNKYQEAFYKYGNHYWTWFVDERFQADLKTLQELVDRTTPVIPTGQHDYGLGDMIGYCECGHYVYDHWKHCVECGRELDWSSEQIAKGETK